MERIGVGKNVSFAGETAELDSGEAIAFEGEVTVTDVELAHDGRSMTVLQTDYEVTLQFDGHESFGFAATSLGDDRVSFTANAVDGARESGLSVDGGPVADRIVDALEGM